MDLSRMSDVDADLEVAVVDDTGPGLASRVGQSPAPKSRSLSDGGRAMPNLTPSPHIVEGARQRSKDDITIRDKEGEHSSLLPSTPVRTGFPPRGLALQMPQREAASSACPSAYVRPTPPSPKLDHAYASPTNILPRRSRGLDFSRAATSLHHSILADQASPDSSPTIGSRAMNIPGRRHADYGATDHTATSLWSMMGNQERMHISSSVGSTTHAASDLSSSSEDDDYMDEDMDEAYVTTPQVQKMGMPPGVMGAPWAMGSPAVSSFLSFQQRQRQRKHPKKKPRGPLGLGLHSPGPIASKSPPNHLVGPHDMSLHARRESISAAANQLHISGNESDDNHSRPHDVDNPLRPSIVRRTVTRRGNLLPKTKGFARIRAALAEESAPIESEFRREAEVVRQVRESDMDLEPRHPPPPSAGSTALSSPNLATHDSLEEVTDDIMMMDPGASALGLAGTFKQQALKQRKAFSDALSEMSASTTQRVTPPPPSLGLARAPSSGMSIDDVSMGSPSASSNGGNGTGQANPFLIPGAQTTASSSGNGTPLRPPGHNTGSINSSSQHPQTTHSAPAPTAMPPIPGPPTAAEITRRINSKRRRGDDDLDPVSIKRRAVSPGMSVHNSPIMQSPLQRDSAPWGSSSMTASRPGSVGGESTGGTGNRNGSGAGSESGSVYGNGNGGAGALGGSTGRGGGKGRVGFQGMVETNDGITRLAIE